MHSRVSGPPWLRSALGPKAKMQNRLSLCLLTFCAVGCVVPLPSTVTSGHRYSKQEIAFLDLPGTTREEVLSTLGEPVMEVPGSGVLLYVWKKTPRAEFIPPDQVGKVHLDTHSSTIEGEPQQWGLFIAYDERGYVTAHETRKFDGTAGFSQACIGWRQSKTQK